MKSKKKGMNSQNRKPMHIGKKIGSNRCITACLVVVGGTLDSAASLENKIYTYHHLNWKINSEYVL